MVVWQRTLTVYVDVLEEWLLPDEAVITDEDAIAADAWEELRSEVANHLKWLYHGQPGFPSRLIPKFVDVGWEDKPEKEV